MNKYDPLWKYIQNYGRDTVILSFEEIGKIATVGIDHSSELQEVIAQLRLSDG